MHIHKSDLNMQIDTLDVENALFAATTNPLLESSINLLHQGMHNIGQFTSQRTQKTLYERKLRKPCGSSKNRKNSEMR